MLLNAAKCQGYNFYCFWVIKGKPTNGGEGGGVKLQGLTGFWKGLCTRFNRYSFKILFF